MAGTTSHTKGNTFTWKTLPAETYSKSVPNAPYSVQRAHAAHHGAFNKPMPVDTQRKGLQYESDTFTLSIRYFATIGTHPINSTKGLSIRKRRFHHGASNNGASKPRHRPYQQQGFHRGKANEPSTNTKQSKSSALSTFKNNKSAYGALSSPWHHGVRRLAKQSNYAFNMALRSAIRK